MQLSRTMQSYVALAADMLHRQMTAKNNLTAWIDASARTRLYSVTSSRSNHDATIDDITGHLDDLQRMVVQVSSIMQRASTEDDGNERSSVPVMEVCTLWSPSCVLVRATTFWQRIAGAMAGVCCFWCCRQA
jgi:hypothetical protein